MNDYIEHTEHRCRRPVHPSLTGDAGERAADGSSGERRHAPTAGRTASPGDGSPAGEAET